MKKILAVFLPIIMVLVICMPANANESDTYLSEEIQGYCIEAGEEYGICPELLMAIIETESSGNPDAMNGWCVGLMQIYTKYHWDRLEKVSGDDMPTIAGFFSPKWNIEMGADYLAELFEEYGDVAYVLDIYNGNSKAKYNYEHGIISDYAQKILERSAELERIHGK